jgi:putative endonuclease
VLKTNYRVRTGEIDVVAQAGQTTVFVEVKTRRSLRYGTPEESMTPTKQKRLVEAAESYLAEHAIESSDWRIDLIAIQMDSKGKVRRINRVENAVSG